jgi:hypothetical protein
MKIMAFRRQLPFVRGGAPYHSSMNAGVATLERLASEIEAQIRKEAYSKSDWG